MTLDLDAIRFVLRELQDRNTPESRKIYSIWRDHRGDAIASMQYLVDQRNRLVIALLIEYRMLHEQGS